MGAGLEHLELPLEKLGAAVPDALKAVVAKALAKDYRESYPSAQHFLAALEGAGQKTGLTTMKAASRAAQTPIPPGRC